MPMCHIIMSNILFYNLTLEAPEQYALRLYRLSDFLREGSQRTCERVHPSDALERRARPERVHPSEGHAQMIQL
jgi:hypothetical protein